MCALKLSGVHPDAFFRLLRTAPVITNYSRKSLLRAKAAIFVKRTYRLCFFLDSNLTTIVTASGANGMIDMELATVGAYCQCGSYSLIMSSSLQCSSLGLSSFRMCHFFFYLLLLSNIFRNLSHRGSISFRSLWPPSHNSASDSPTHCPSGCT